MTDSSAGVKPPPAWRIWDNPIFRRYTRSRLRMKGLMPWLLLTVIFSAFIFLFVPVSSRRIEEFSGRNRVAMRQHLEEAMRNEKNSKARENIEKELLRLTEPAKPA